MEYSEIWKEEVTFRLEPDSPVTVSKFRSLHSGLTLVLVDVDGPIIEACFCVSKSIIYDHGRGFTSRYYQNNSMNLMKQLMTENIIEAEYGP